MTNTKKPLRKSTIIAIAIVLSLLLYIAGVLSGLYANKLLKQETENNMNVLKNQTKKEVAAIKEETQETIQYLQQNIHLLRDEFESIQIEQAFLDVLDPKEQCAYSTHALQTLIEKLQYYWQRLPERLEAYEQQETLSTEYQMLKQQYIDLSLRTWIIAKKRYNLCKTDMIQGIYFYSARCKECIRQGEALDKLKHLASNKEIMIVTIDFSSTNTIVAYLKEYYQLQEEDLPVLILNDHLFKNSVYEANELLQALEQKENATVIKPQ
ncbi:MAG: hypothetical protein QW594_01365 [Candidatus Woesearchaeota archaeon]